MDFARKILDNNNVQTTTNSRDYLKNVIKLMKMIILSVG